MVDGGAGFDGGVSAEDWEIMRNGTRRRRRRV